MAYIPNPYDATNPLDSVDAGSMAAEFRSVKGFFGGVLGRDMTPSNTVNSGATIIILSKTVPAGAMGIDKKLRIKWFAHVDNSTGSNQNFTAALALGAAGLIANTALLAPGASVLSFDMEIMNVGAANSQLVTCRIDISAGFVVIPITVSALTSAGLGIAEAAVDTSIDQILEVRYAMGIASALFAVKTYGVTVERI